MRPVAIVRITPLLVFVLLAACGAARTPDDSSRTLIAASNMLHPPFSSWSADGHAVGIEVEIVEQAASDLGLQVSWVERPFSELLTAIESGEIDLAVSTIGITESRRRRVAFSDPYYQTQIVALVRNDDSSPRSLSELAHSRIGAAEATTSHAAAMKQWPSATLVGQANEGVSWPQMVEQGLVDAFIVDASDQQRQESTSGISLHRIEQPLSAEHFGVALPLGKDELLAALNSAVQARAKAICPLAFRLRSAEPVGAGTESRCPRDQSAS